MQRACAGRCFVTFYDKEDAKKYYDILQFEQFCGRTLMVGYGNLKVDREDAEERSKQARANTNKLFMSNLCWDVNDKEIHRFLGVHHNDKLKIEQIDYNVGANGFPKGSAIITFETIEMAVIAFYKAKGGKLRNRDIIVDFVVDDNNNNNNDNYDYNEY